MRLPARGWIMRHLVPLGIVGLLCSSLFAAAMTSALSRNEESYGSFGRNYDMSATSICPWGFIDAPSNSAECQAVFDRATADYVAERDRDTQLRALALWLAFLSGGVLAAKVVMRVRGSRARCPHCMRVVHAQATVCSYCQRDLVASSRGASNGLGIGSRENLSA